MVDEEEPQEIKPMVDYAFLPSHYYEDSEEETEADKFLKDYAITNKLPKNFGTNVKELSDEIKNKLYSFYNNKYLEENNNNTLPSSNVVSFSHTKKKVLYCLDVDKNCNRFITGGEDGIVKIWDFNSITRKPKPNHVIDCGEEGNFPVFSVSWSPSGGFFLACTGGCQAKVVSRDGVEEISCIKGDNYIVDVRNTKGHTYGLKDGKWHPYEKNIFITSSVDSTIRLWDIYGKQQGIDSDITQKTIFKAKTLKNKKIPINCCNYSNDAKLIVGGVNDGSIQFFTPKIFYPQIYIPNAHKNPSEITSIIFSENEINFYSRATDDTMKLWDIRHYNKPIHIWENLHCNLQRTDICLSPNEDIVLTGTSIIKSKNIEKEQFGEIKCFSTKDYKLLDSYKISNSSVTSIHWKEKINQILVGTTDGYCHIYFDPKNSKNGIITSIFKKPKYTREKEDNFIAPAPIITPMQLPLFEETEFTRTTYLEKITDPTKLKEKSDVPKSKDHYHSTISQHIMRNINKALYEEDDPQEALSKFRGKEGEKGVWVDKAYQETQPKSLLDNNPQIEEEVIFYEQIKKPRCPNCGLKFCTCNKSIFKIPIEKLASKKNNF